MCRRRFWYVSVHQLELKFVKLLLKSNVLTLNQSVTKSGYLGKKAAAVARAALSSSALCPGVCRACVFAICGVIKNCFVN